MLSTTTVRHSPSKPKAFSWSYSKLKNFDTCPKRYYHYDVARDVKEDEDGNEHLLYGKIVHESLAARLGKGTPIPELHAATLEPWAQRVLKGAANAADYKARTGGTLMVEQKLAMTKDFEACDFFDKVRHPWWRGIGDVVAVNGPVALTLDWKTGRIVEDSVQLALTAAYIFAAFPHVQRVRSSFVWLKEDAQTNADMSRADLVPLWAGVLPRVHRVEQAHANNEFPAKPSGLCRRFCGVTKCPHHGE